jgi:hypothetical protein
LPSALTNRREFAGPYFKSQYGSTNKLPHIWANKPPPSRSTENVQQAVAQLVNRLLTKS